MFFQVFVPRGETVRVEPPKGKTFDIVVPAPQDAMPKVFHLFNGELSEGLLPPPPPPPPPPEGMMIRNPQFGFLATRGIRVLRPGEKPSDEELDRFIHSFPEQSLVQVERLDDGTIRRIMVQSRRLADAPKSIPFPDPSVFGDHVTAGATTAEPAAAADGVH
jgi:hypothetical protein